MTLKNNITDSSLIVTDIDMENKEITVSSNTVYIGDGLRYTTSNSTIWSGTTWSAIDERLPIYIQGQDTQYFEPEDYYRITQLALEIYKKEQQYKLEFKELINSDK